MVPAAASPRFAEVFRLAKQAKDLPYVALPKALDDKIADPLPVEYRASVPEAASAFYEQHSNLIDGYSYLVEGVANDDRLVGVMNSLPWAGQQFSSAMEYPRLTGRFTPVQEPHPTWVVNSIYAGVGAELQLGVGVGGGLGCIWDCVGLESARGFTNIMGIVGPGVIIDVNIQAGLFNVPPSQLNRKETIGTYASLVLGWGPMLQIIFDESLHPLGFIIGIGFGVGATLSLYSGKIFTW